MAIDSKQDIQSEFIPFVGGTLSRGSSLTKDQYFYNSVFQTATNSATGKATYWATQRPGLLNLGSLIDSGSTGSTLYNWSRTAIGSSFSAKTISISSSGIYDGITQLISGATYTTTNSVWAESNQSATDQTLSVSTQQGLYVLDSTPVATFLSNTAIVSVSATNPAVVTTATAHNLGTGTYVYLRGVTGSTPDVNGIATGKYLATVLTPTTFSIPVNCTVAGAGGDMGFPISSDEWIGNVIQMNGYLYCITKDGRIFDSEFNDPYTWVNTRFVTCQQYSGIWIGLAKQNNFLLAFSSRSMQTFIDNANPSPGSPLENYESGVQQIGMHFFSPRATNVSASSNGQQLTWIGSTGSGQRTVYSMNGLETPKEIATTVIRQFIQNNGIYNRAKNVQVEGRNLYIIPSSSSSYPTLVYDFELDLWSYWGFANSIQLADITVGYDGSSIYALSTTGTGYTLNAPFYQDDSVAFDFYVQTNRIDFGTQNRKFLKKLEFVSDKTADPTNLLVTYSDDDYQTTSTARTLNLSAAHTFLPIGGNFRRRSYKFSYSGINKQRWFGFELYFRMGTS